MARLSRKTGDFLKLQPQSFCWFYQKCVNSPGSTASFVSAMLMGQRWWELYCAAYGMRGCLLYLHAPICHYLSLQLAILPKYKLLRISIIRAKMWGFKMRQCDFKGCAEQGANSVFFLCVLDCCHRSCITFIKPLYNLKYHFEEQQIVFESFHYLA